MTKIVLKVFIFLGWMHIPVFYFLAYKSIISGNYVFSCDEYLDRQEPEYDTIIAFSITKWVHLNNGDQVR